MTRFHGVGSVKARPESPTGCVKTQATRSAGGRRLPAQLFRRAEFELDSPAVFLYILKTDRPLASLPAAAVRRFDTLNKTR
jgi:hypothetical protein